MKRICTSLICFVIAFSTLQQVFAEVDTYESVMKSFHNTPELKSKYQKEHKEEYLKFRNEFVKKVENFIASQQLRDWQKIRIYHQLWALYSCWSRYRIESEESDDYNKRILDLANGKLSKITIGAKINQVFENPTNKSLVHLNKWMDEILSMKNDAIEAKLLSTEKGFLGNDTIEEYIQNDIKRMLIPYKRVLLLSLDEDKSKIEDDGLRKEVTNILEKEKEFLKEDFSPLKTYIPSPLQKYKCIVFKKPILLKSDSSSKLEENIKILPFISLQKRFWNADSYEEILPLFTKDSLKQIKKKNFEMRAKNRAFSRKYTAYVSCKINGEEIMIAQTLPGQLKDKDISKSKFFIAKGVRKVNKDWKFDKTLSKTDLAKVVSKTNPKNLNKAIGSFFKEKNERK